MYADLHHHTHYNNIIYSLCNNLRNKIIKGDECERRARSKQPTVFFVKIYKNNIESKDR
jgi:hypothetical protein